MAVRVSVSGGMPADAVRRMQRDILVAQKAGIAGATEFAKESIRRDIRAYSSSSRLPNIVGSKVYPEGRRLAYRPAGEIYARGKKAAQILEQMASGAPIRAKGGRFLAIPLHSMRRGGGSGRLARPDEIEGLFFVASRGGLGGYAGVLAVRKDSGVGSRAARGMARLRTRLRRGAGWRQRGIVPMFALFRQVRSRKVFDQQDVVRQAMALMPGLIDRAFAQAQAASARAPAGNP